jgi:hypothetical protein
MQRHFATDKPWEKKGVVYYIHNYSNGLYRIEMSH